MAAPATVRRMSTSTPALTAATLLLGATLAGCGDDGAATPDAAPGPRDWPAMTVPTSTVPEPGIRREVVLVDGADAPANPVSGVDTPGELDRTQLLRFRRDLSPPAPARAVVVMMPGFLGGGGSYEPLARHLVRRAAAAGETIEVWAIDRRGNLLEDRLGVDTAEAAGDPEIADAWYFGQDTIGGQRYLGPRPHAELGFMSEWGLATHAEDTRAIIAQIAAADRKGHVVLVGHSMGASFAEAYAAWRFSDGTRGSDELAGVVLIDGALADAPLTEAEWHAGASAGLGRLAGVDELRGDGDKYFELPLLGNTVYPRVDVLSQRALRAPDAVVVDRGRDEVLGNLLLLPRAEIPAMSNAAALGWAMDDDSNALTFAAVSAGEAVGGAVESYDNPLAMAALSRPSDPSATYTWVDAAAADPSNVTPLANLAHTFVDGPTDFAEWYFPIRLPLDLAAVGGARVAPDGWQAAAGLRAFDGALADAPVLAVSTQLVSPADFEQVRARWSAPVGPGRPGAGATRDQVAAFEVVVAADQTHIDPLTAADRADNPVPAAVLAFVLRNVTAGTVAVPPAL
jgi:hypothetical protein